eukprot:scaffold1437_cov113-Cylindrotheca_fusiformis.AAC.4
MISIVPPFLALLLSASCHAFLHVVVPSQSYSDGFTITGALHPRKIHRRQSWLRNHSWMDGGDVRVRVQKSLSFVSPTEALHVWLEQHWRKGGGLPIVVSEGATHDDETTLRKRVIYPVVMEESLFLPVSNTTTHPETTTLRYHVSKPGPFFADLVAGSHEGVVTMSSEEDTMTWEVNFATNRFRRIYQLMTEFTINVAARTVEEAMKPSSLFTLKATIPGSEVEEDPLIHTRRELLEFFWARGGGLPLLPPIPYGELLSNGVGAKVRRKLLRIPPLITETIVSTNYSTDEVAEIVYELEKPGWTTFPFLLHTHLGRIQFLRSETGNNKNDVDMVWQVEITPWPVVSPIVKTLVEMTISTITRNFMVHMSEPKATIEVTSFWSLSKASWLGGVLDSQSKDKRSMWHQSTSFLQPWTWGRSGDGSERDAMVRFTWSDKEGITIGRVVEAEIMR